MGTTADPPTASPEHPLPKKTNSKESSGQRLKEAADSAWLWGAIGLVAGAAASVAPEQSLPWIFGVAWFALSVACFRHFPFRVWWLKWPAVLVASLAIGYSLHGLDRKIVHSLPKPKDPPTAQENAEAVIQLEKAQGLLGAPPSKPSEFKPPHPIRHPNPPVVAPPPKVAVASLTITQSPDTSTEPNNPYKTNVVVQTDREFTGAVKLAVECDGPISHGHGGINGMMLMTGEGVVQGHANVFVLTYQSAMPTFGPANPIQISLWSQQPINCSRVSTF